MFNSSSNKIKTRKFKSKDKIDLHKNIKTTFKSYFKIC